MGDCAFVVFSFVTITRDLVNADSAPHELNYRL